MLETERVEKSFGSIKVIKEVGLYLKQGEAVGLLGPNGAGKSTLIDMLSSLSKPTKVKCCLMASLFFHSCLPFAIESV